MSKKQQSTPAEIVAAAKPKRRRPSVGNTNRKRCWKCELRTVRKLVGLSMRDVADGMEAAVSTIYQLEQGTDPQLTTATKLADFFGKTIRELWPERLESVE